MFSVRHSASTPTLDYTFPPFWLVKQPLLSKCGARRQKLCSSYVNLYKISVYIKIFCTFGELEAEFGAPIHYREKSIYVFGNIKYSYIPVQLKNSLKGLYCFMVPIQARATVIQVILGFSRQLMARAMVRH